jgi:AcrR family transcriptional regulator
MSPKFVDKEQKIKEIALTALKLFSQKGYAGTNVGQIAKSAGIGKGTIYEYFETKEDIFIAAIMEWISQFEFQLSAIDDPVQRLFAVAEMTVKWVDPLDPATMRLSLEILQQSLMEGGVIFKKLHLAKKIHDGLRRMVMDILLDGISRGIFKPEIARDAETIANNLLACLDGISLHSLLSRNDFDLKSQIDFYMQNLINRILIEPTTRTSFEVS